MTTGRKLSYALAFGFLILVNPARALDLLDHQPIATLAAALKSSGQVRIAQGMQDILASDTNGQLVPAASLLFLTTEKDTAKWTISVLHDKIVGSTLLIGNSLQKISTTEVPSLPTFNRQKAGLAAAYYPDEVQRLGKDGFKRLFTGRVTFMLNSALAIASAYRQHEIDANKVTLTIDRKPTEISQGDLRRIMTERVKSLEVQRQQLESNNGDAAEITRITNLVKQYQSSTPAGAEATTPDLSTMKPVFADVLVDPNANFHVLVVDQYGACAEMASGASFGDRR